MLFLHTAAGAFVDAATFVRLCEETDGWVVICDDDREVALAAYYNVPGRLKELQHLLPQPLRGIPPSASGEPVPVPMFNGASTPFLRVLGLPASGAPTPLATLSAAGRANRFKPSANPPRCRTAHHVSRRSAAWPTPPLPSLARASAGIAGRRPARRCGWRTAGGSG